MAVLRSTTNAILNRILVQPPFNSFSLLVSETKLSTTHVLSQRGISLAQVRCTTLGSRVGGKVSAWLSQVQQLL